MTTSTESPSRTVVGHVPDCPAWCTRDAHVYDDGARTHEATVVRVDAVHPETGPTSYDVRVYALETVDSDSGDISLFELMIEISTGHTALEFPASVGASIAGGIAAALRLL